MTFSKLILPAAIITMLCLPAYALDLQQARVQGLVGEQTTGYVGIVKASQEAQHVAAQVNAKRRQEYERISKENGQPADVVAKLAAEQIISNLPSGSYYQAADGSWKQR